MKRVSTAIRSVLNIRGVHYATIVFVIAFSTRLIPELLSPNYPVGYDVAIYSYQVPHIHERPLPSLLRGTPMFYLIAWALLRATGIDVLLLLKLMGPLMYGLLMLSFYVFLRKALGWDRRWSLLCATICALQVPALRLSWDLFRNELGLAMLFLFMASASGRSRPRWLITTLLALLTTLSHQLASVSMFIWSFFQIISARDRNREYMTKMVLCLLPSATLFSYQLAAYLGLLPPPAPVKVERVIIRLQPPNPRANRPFTNYFLCANFLGTDYLGLVRTFLKLLLICYLPLCPLALMGLKRHRALDLLTVWFSIGAFSFLLCPQAYPFYSFFRWLMFLVFPISAYAINGLARIKSKTQYWRYVLACALIAYLLMGVSYASGTIYCINDEDVNAYLPWSLMQSTIGVGQIDDCIACLQWLNHHAGDNAVLITEQRFYAWALNFLDRRIAIAWYPHGYPIDLVPIASVLEEYEEAYLIWYSGYNVPGFREVFTSHDIAIYRVLA